MKVKTIKKIITQKMNEWLITLPVGLADKVRENIVVSGGSIASMLLREPVNDFDVYIQDMNVLKELAIHYCPDKVLDGRKREEYLEQRFPYVDADGNSKMPVDIEAGEEEEYLSEDYVRIFNLKPDQIKLDIVSTGVRIDNVEEKNEKGENNYLPVFLSQNAISLTNDVQIVLRFNGTVEEIHKTFDFIHATNYFTMKEGVVTNLQAMESLITKDLMYQGSLYPLTSIIRMKKFIARGWTISAGEILKIMYQISFLNLTDLKVLEEQLIGVDVAYFGLLIDALRTVPKEKMTTNYINSLIDKIFREYDEDTIKPKNIEEK